MNRCSIKARISVVWYTPDAVVIEADRKPGEQDKRFIDLLKMSEYLDCELIIGDCEMPVGFLWDKDSRITEAGYLKFKSLMDACYDVLDNGNIEVFCDDYDLGEIFVYAAAGYINEFDFITYFNGEWCR